jgi:hypothetical protein
VVDTYDSDFSAKVVMMTWHTNIVRRSAGLGTLLNSEDHDVAAAFHQETITCLQSATRHSEIVDVLEDFAREVLTDLELKDITFRSRELIINCQQLLENLVSLPAIQQRERGRHTEVLPVHANQARLDAESKKLAQSAVNNVRALAERKKKNTSSTASLAFSDTSEYEIEPMSVEQEHKVKVIAVDRMKLIYCILKVRTARACSHLLGKLDWLNAYHSQAVVDRTRRRCATLGRPTLFCCCVLRSPTPVSQMFSSLLFSSESLSSRFVLLLGPRYV